MAFNAQEQLGTIPVVAQQSAHMTRLFTTWPEAYWQHATACAGWTAADVVAHLATGADFYTQVLTAGRTGEPGLPWDAQSLDEVRSIRAAAVRKLLTGGAAALLAGFEAAAGRLQEVLESLQASDLTKMAWHPSGVIPIGCWIGMRLIELTVHDWDIRQPHENNAPLSPLAVPAVLTSLPEMQLRFLQQRLPAGCQGVHALQVDTRNWAFAIEGQQVTYQAASPSTCTTVLRTDAESIILLTLGRADFDARRQHAACTLTGDLELGKRLYTSLFSPYLSSSATA